MKEPYGKGVANHPGPESYAVSREAGGGALTRARIGWVLSSEIVVVGGADAVKIGGRQHSARRYREMGWDLPESETPCMCGTTLRWNWEISSPPTADGAVGRIGKPIGVRR